MALIQCNICRQIVSDKAASCPHCGNAIVKPQYRVRYRDYIKSPIPDVLRPQSYMIYSILLGLASLILFTVWCLPFAIVSFIYANKVDDLWEKGDIDGAIFASHTAHKWYSIGLWVGVSSWLLFFFVMFFIFIGLID